MLNTLGFIFSIITFILITILFIILLVKIYPRVPQKFELFSYNKNDVCIGELVKKENPNCPKNKFNGIHYVKLNWNNAKKNQYATLYITVAEDDEIQTKNYWLSIYDDKNKETIGTLRWTNCQLQNSKIVRSSISAASGILQLYQNQNVLIDFRTENIKLYIYTNKIDNSTIRNAEKLLKSN